MLWFKRKEVKVEDYLTQHKIGDKTYNVPDSTMTGKIVYNDKGEPEIAYFKMEEIKCDAR